jgi:hypothetical protein
MLGPMKEENFRRRRFVIEKLCMLGLHLWLAIDHFYSKMWVWSDMDITMESCRHPLQR